MRHYVGDMAANINAITALIAAEDVTITRHGLRRYIQRVDTLLPVNIRCYVVICLRVTRGYIQERYGWRVVESLMSGACRCAY